jgi:hypothetical protein
MSRDKEKSIYEFMDQLEPYQVQNRINNIEVSEDETIENKTIINIKSRVFSNLGISFTDEGNETLPNDISRYPFIRNSSIRPKKWTKIVWTSLCASLLCFYLITSASPNIWAQVNKVIWFLPGFGSIEKADDAGVLYTLPSPISLKVNRGQIEIRGISVGENYSSISTVGADTSSLKTVALINKDGKKYIFKSGLRVESGDWAAGFYYNGSINITDNMMLSFENNQTIVPIRLELAKKADRVENLGEVSIKQGISLTAITSPLTDNKKRVTIIPQLPEGLSVNSYGFSAYDKLMKPSLKTEQNDEVTIEQQENFPILNEFNFQIKRAADNYKLIIPSLEVTRKVNEPIKVSVKVPHQGTIEVNKRFEFQNISFDLLRVERVSTDAIRIYFDMLYNSTASESLLYFTPDLTANDNNKADVTGAGFKTNESTGALEYMDLMISKSDTEYMLIIKEMHSLIRGPWEFTLK